MDTVVPTDVESINARAIYAAREMINSGCYDMYRIIRILEGKSIT